MVKTQTGKLINRNEGKESEDDSDSSVYSGLEDDEVESDQESDIGIIKENEATESSAQDEYQHDSSDEEDIRNTVGNIPMKWYDEYQHLGYDWEARKIPKPMKADELDKFLNKMENPDYWRTVHDPSTGQDVVLADEDVDVINRVQQGLYPDGTYDPFAPWIDFFSFEKSIHPVTNHPEHKRSFIPSLVEKEKVSKLVHAIKMGWLKPKEATKDKKEPKFYIMWEHDEQIQQNKRFQHFIPAPKMKLPGHEESYNPPPEYLFDKDEEEKWRNQEPEDRKLDFLPRKHSSLREVPAYDDFIQDRFQRCLDLYLCPRQRKMRLNVNPEDLIPKLPKPKDLHPFPTTLSLCYKGHKAMVRCITAEPTGQFLASGCDEGTIKIWEVQTGRCLRTVATEGAVTSIAWCPNKNMCLIAATIGKTVVILNPSVGDKLIISNTNLLFSQSEEIEAESSASVDDIEWNVVSAQQQQSNGYKIILNHPKEVKQISWHCKGDYFATVMPNAGSKSVFIHQLSKRRSQQPFKRNKGLIQTVLFHPTRPYFFVATQQHVRIYNLLKQEMTKKLMTNCKWVSSMAIHSGGDNVIVGSYDSRLSWFDLDLSTKPYQTLKHHKKAIRQVAFHKRYPLFASASDDCSVIISHGMVYNDLLQNPLIVPVKFLYGHRNTNDFGVMDCQFHPTQPWIFTSGADGNIFLYT